MQNDMHNFLRHSKPLDVQIALGVWAAICTGTFKSGVTDRPGAFSVFCCGPQAIEAATLGGKEADEQTNSLIQMQLKTTCTTTGLSKKDIKNVTNFGLTFPWDFYELARLVQNMAGVTELLFGFNARLTVMLDNWHQFLTRAPGTTIPTLCQLAQADPSLACQLAQADPSLACQLGWFIDRRMQQFLVLCASGRHEDVIKVKSWWDGVKKHVNEALNRRRNNVIKSLKQLFKGKECAFCFKSGNIFQLLVLTTAITQKKYLDSTVMLSHLIFSRLLECGGVQQQKRITLTSLIVLSRQLLDTASTWRTAQGSR
jgi:hypothetical protein